MELPKLEYEDINSGLGTLNKDISIKKDSRKGLLFKKGDVLFGKLRPYLKNWWLAEFDGIAMGDFWNLRSGSLLNTFLYTYIQSVSFQIVANDTSGTKMPRSDWKLISESTIKFPSISEQQSIGSYFSTLDHLITLQQCERHFHNSDAKSSFSEIISHHIEGITAIIFHSYTNTWEQRKLGTIAIFSKGKGYTKKDLANAGTKIILYGRMYTDFQFSIESTDTFVVAQDDSVYSEGNEVLIPSSGETPTDIARASAITKSGIIIGGDLNIVQPNKDIILPEFLALQLTYSYIQKELSKRAQGKTVVHLHNSDLKEILIFIPKLEEQHCFVKQFLLLDHLITLQQCKPLVFISLALKAIS